MLPKHTSGFCSAAILCIRSHAIFCNKCGLNGSNDDDSVTVNALALVISTTTFAEVQTGTLGLSQWLTLVQASSTLFMVEAEHSLMQDAIVLDVSFDQVVALPSRQQPSVSSSANSQLVATIAA